MTNVGRPSKLDDDVKLILIAARKKGISKKDAAIKAGIGESTFQLWQTKAKEAKEQGKTNEYLELMELLEATKVDAVLDALESIITAHKKGDWRAAAWLAAKLRPDEFGDKQNVKLEHSGEMKFIVKVKP